MSSLRFTLIQSDLHWEKIAKNISMFEAKINAISEPLEIVVLPEMFTTGFSLTPTFLAEEMNGDTIAWMTKMAKEKRIILTGSVMMKENSQFFNRLIWMQPDGEFGYYDKRHLFSYGGEDRQFSSGSKRFIAQVKGWKICTMVCYDLRFPVWNRMSNEAEYDVLLYVANWPKRRIDAWKTLLKARAIENQCYVVAVNRVGTDGMHLSYNGESCVINPLGEVLYSKADAEDIFTIDLDKELIQQTRTTFPFQKDKDAFVIM